jgi:cytochrome c553
MNRLVLALSVASLMAAGSAHAQNPEAGREKARPCAACHGPDGNSPSPEFPRIAGQHYDYLVRTLQEYRSGTRKNAIMQPQAANLTDRDIRDLAAFYSRQPGLVTIDHGRRHTPLRN